MNELGIQSLPTLMAVVNGKVVDMCIGVPDSSRLQELFVSLLLVDQQDLSSPSSSTTTLSSDIVDQTMKLKELSSKLFDFAGKCLEWIHDSLIMISSLVDRSIELNTIFELT